MSPAEHAPDEVRELLAECTRLQALPDAESKAKGRAIFVRLLAEGLRPPRQCKHCGGWDNE